MTENEIRAELIRRELARREAAKATGGGQAVQPTQDASSFAGSVRSILQPLTFGFGDEIESAIRGVPHAQIQADMKKWESDYPEANLAGQIGGGAATVLAGGGLFNAAKSSLPAVGRLAGYAAENIPQWAQIVGSSAAAGGLYGAGSADPGARLEGAAVGAGTGAAVAGGLLAGGAVAGKAYESILKPLWRHLSSTPTKDARFLIQDTLRRAGMTPDDALSALQESGDQAMMLDLSPYLRDLAYDVRSGIGPGRGMIDEALKSRQLGQQARILGSAGQTLGVYADDAQKFISEISKAQREQAAPLYTIAHQQNIRTTPEFEKLWEGIPKSAIRDARKLAEKEWRAGLLQANFPEVERVVNASQSLPGQPGGLLEKGADAFNFDDLPDVLRIDYVKRAYDDIIGAQLRNAGKKQLSRADITIRNKLLDLVDEQVPEFKQARGIWAGAEQLKSASELGREAFKQDADELADIVKRYGDSEKQAFRYGLAQALRDQIEGTSSSTSDAARRLAGSAKSQRIIKAAFGNNDEFARFMKQIEQEGVFTESRYEIAGNSKTGERLQRRSERVGDIPDPTRAGWVDWLRRNFGPSDPLRNETTNRLVAEWLTQQRPVVPYAPGLEPMRPPLEGLLSLPTSRR